LQWLIGIRLLGRFLGIGLLGIKRRKRQWRGAVWAMRWEWMDRTDDLCLRKLQEEQRLLQ
jgi:hypothetical protein